MAAHPTMRSLACALRIESLLGREDFLAREHAFHVASLENFTFLIAICLRFAHMRASLKWVLLR